MPLKIAVIGSGIGGIASAIRMAIRGHEVHVFEQNDYPGGKLSEVRLGDFRFDAGPSLFTMPELVDELFALAGENPDDFFQYQQLKEVCEYFYEDGTRLTAFADQEKLIEELASIGEAPHNIRKALERNATLYEYLGEMFMFRSLHDPKTYFSKSAFRSYRNLHKLDFFRTMDQANKDQFDDPRMTQLFNRYATYNGSDPYQTPATMNIISHLEYGKGAYFPKGGMHQITKSLVKLAERKGVTFHLNSPVDKILTKNKHVVGIQLAGNQVDFDRVISNMDVVGTYKKLLTEIRAPKNLLTQPKSSSALIFYWGIKEQFPELGLHNIIFSRDYQQEFGKIFQEKTIDEDPTVYINITSKLNQNDAPEGSENWFTMINVPNNDGQDWDALIGQARENILKKLSRVFGRPVESLIEEESLLEPRTIESKTSSSQGALYGNSSNNKFAAFLRHNNVSRQVKGLFFCGGSVHPGGGIPMALSSAKIVDRYFQ
ncbi:MAG: 1-hydroxycarotenoid 3,4-desaturase CrtD [Cytophagales bacterium]|nr:1-hydroxycarotenoid 3,4-desaturase CrtD [Cytophagales bacterium]